MEINKSANYSGAVSKAGQVIGQAAEGIKEKASKMASGMMDLFTGPQPNLSGVEKRKADKKVGEQPLYEKKEFSPPPQLQIPRQASCEVIHLRVVGDSQILLSDAPKTTIKP